MSTKVELLRILRGTGDVSVIEELRSRDFLSADSNRTFGVEIECIFPTNESINEFIDDINNNSNLEIRFVGYNHTTSAAWKMVTDASVRSTTKPGIGREVVSPILKGADGKRQLKTILECMKKHGVYINKTCGLHVHFGAKDFKAADFRKLAHIYKQHEAEIDKMVSPSRRGQCGNQYCQGLDHISHWQIENCASVRQLDSKLGGRYHKINFAAFVRHGTVEFRQHQGSIDFEKISQWIDFGMCMMRWAKYSKVSYSAPLFDGCEFSANACTYWERRIAELAA